MGVALGLLNWPWLVVTKQLVSSLFRSPDSQQQRATNCTALFSGNSRTSLSK